MTLKERVFVRENAGKVDGTMANIEPEVIKLVKLLSCIKRHMRSFVGELQQDWGQDAVRNELEVMQLENGHTLEFFVELKKEAEEFLIWWFEINLNENGWLIARCIMKNQNTFEEFPDVKFSSVDEMLKKSSDLVNELLSTEVS